MDEGQIVRMFEEGYRAFEEGDYDAATAMFADDFVLVRPAGGGEVSGRDAVRTFYEPDAFSEMRFEIEAIEVFGEVMVVSAHVHAVGSTSGIELSNPSIQVWWMREGLMTRSEVYLTRAEAFEAAGVPDPRAAD